MGIQNIHQIWIVGSNAYQTYIIDFIKRNVILSIIRIIVKMIKNNLLLMLIEINKDGPKYIFGLGPSSVEWPFLSPLRLRKGHSKYILVHLYLFQLA